MEKDILEQEKVESWNNEAKPLGWKIVRRKPHYFWKIFSVFALLIFCFFAFYYFYLVDKEKFKPLTENKINPVFNLTSKNSFSPVDNNEFNNEFEINFDLSEEFLDNICGLCNSTS